MIKPFMNKLEIHLRRFLWFVAVAFIFAGCSQTENEVAPKPIPGAERKTGHDELTALDKYVAAADPNYSFHLVTSIPGNGLTTFILEMTSQAWLTTNEVDRPLWKHWLTIVKPDHVTSSKSLLFIGGGANGGSPPKAADGNLVQVAIATKSVVSELKWFPTSHWFSLAKPRAERRTR